MNLTELKQKNVQELLEMAEELGIENIGRSRKQDVIFAILKAKAKKKESIYGDGVLEILQDGFGFLRSAEASYMAGPDDIYVSHAFRPGKAAKRFRALFCPPKGGGAELR